MSLQERQRDGALPPPLVPRCPHLALLGGRERLVECAQGSFSKTLHDRFRRPLGTEFGRRFWEHVGGRCDDATACVYRGTITEGMKRGALSVDLMVATTLQLEMRLGDLPDPPTVREVGARCYIEAIEYARCKYAERTGGGAGCSSLHLADFYRLLHLYACDEWFAERYLEETSFAPDQAGESQGRRERMAVRILDDAASHYRAVTGGADTRCAAARNAATATPRALLEQLQEEWTPGWIIALSNLRYRWGV